MKIGSLFSGIGGLELGLEWAGLGPTKWQVERDEYATRVLARHWPDAKRFDDVCAVGVSNLEPVDLICGGFPCQDLSFAGKGAGLDGARSGLWREFARIVGELRPRFVVVENVPALLSRGLGVVLGDLATLGFDAWWDCIPASAVGASHERDRTFIVGNSACATRRGEIGASRCQGIYRRSTWRLNGIEVLSASWSCVDRIHDGLPAWLDRDFPSGPSEPQKEWESPRVSKGEANRSDRLRCLGNAVLPQVGYVIGQVVRMIEASL